MFARKRSEACNSVADFKDGKYSIPLCLFHLLCTSKIYVPCSNSFNCVQYLLNRINFFRPWSKVISYLITLSMVKKILVQPNFFLNYGWTDGLGINIFFSFSDCIEDQHWTNYTLFNFKYV